MKIITLVLITLLSLLPMGSWGAVSTIIDGITYSYDPEDVEQGATVTHVADATSITIPYEIKIGDVTYQIRSINDNAIANCSSLTALHIAAEVSIDNLNKHENATISTFSYKGICYYLQNGQTYSVGNGSDSDAKASYTIKEGYKNVQILSSIWTISVTTIKPKAFKNVGGFSTISIPSTITEIGSNAFYGALFTSYTVNEDNPNYSSENSVLFNKDKTTLLYYPRSNANTSYTIGDNVTSIAANAFYNATNLTTVTIGSGITEIPSNAFYNATKLASVTIGENVTTIGSSAFNQAGSENGVSLNVTFNGTSKLKTIGKSAFQESGLASITLPDGLEKIGESAFQKCLKLTSINIPSSVNEFITGATFKECTALATVTFVDNPSLKTITLNAFNGCNALQVVTLPEGITTLSSGAFKPSGLQNIYLPKSIGSINAEALPDGVTIHRTLDVDFSGNDLWATYYSGQDLKPDDTSGLTVYSITGINGTTVNTELLNFIPANSAVLLQRSGTDKLGPFKATTPSVELTGTKSDDNIFKGSVTEITNFNTLSGNRYVLAGDKFVKAHQGTLPKSRCYLINGASEASNLFINRDNNTIIVLEENSRSEENTVGTVNLTKGDGNTYTLTITPKNSTDQGHYVKPEDITVTPTVETTRRAPGIDPPGIVGPLALTPTDATADPSGVTTYTFESDYEKHEVKVNFHLRKKFSENTRVVELDPDYNYTYDGTEKKPSITSFTYNGEDVDEDLNDPKNFNPTYLNNINAGTGIVRIEGLREYVGTYDKTFTISKRDINNVTVMAIPDQIYNGGEIKPVVVVKDIVQIDGVDVDLINKIEDKPDYSLEFINNINAGTAQVNVLSNNINYRGVKTGTTFTILPKDLSLAGNKPTIESIEIQIYTGEPLKPALVIRDGDLLVTPDNYDVEYDNNIVEGTANATVTFKKNYKGTASTTFKIIYKKEQKKLNVEYGEKDEWITYCSPIDLQKVEGVDIFVVTGRNPENPIDLKTEKIDFIPKNIGVLLQRTDKTKTEFYGEAMPSTTKLEGVTPDTDLFRGSVAGITDIKTIEGIKYFLKNDNFIQVVEGPLPANRCYVFISYENDEDINHVEGDDADGIIIQEEGEASKTAGTVVVSEVSSDGYKIITVTPAPVNCATLDEVKVVRSIRNDAPAASSNRVPGIENTLVEVIAVNPAADPSGSTQYKFKYDDAYHYQITVDFQKRVNLSDRSTSNPVVTLKAEDIQNLEYDGKEKKPRVEKVTCNNIKVDPSNYTISYENNVNAGKPRVIITGKRFLMGSTHAEFVISKRNINKVTVKEIPDQFYTGSPITPKLDIKDIIEEGGQSIIDESQYDLVFENNTEIGQAKVNIVAKKINYHNTKVVYFNILLKGDVNGDGLVNVTDIVATVSFVMERPLNGFNKAAADLNGDGEINVTDIVKMVSIIMSDNGAASRRAAATSSYLVISRNNIQLRNAEGYTAAQFDIHLSDGQSINNVVLNVSSDHSLYWKMVDANTYRVVVYSMTNAAFRANSDNLFTVFITGSQNATISNELLIKADGTTGIDAISTEAENGNVYDMNGRQVKTPRKGVYIINGKKVMVK